MKSCKAIKGRKAVNFTSRINSVSILPGVICLLAVAGASDAEKLDMTGLAIGLAGGVLMMAIGAAGNRLRIAALSALRLSLKLLNQFICPSERSSRTGKTLARSSEFSITVETPDEKTEKVPPFPEEARLYSKCS